MEKHTAKVILLLTFTTIIVFFILVGIEINKKQQIYNDLGINNITQKYDVLINKNLSTLVLFVSPDCESCKNEIRTISQNISVLQKQCNLIIISFVDYDELCLFIKNNNLNVTNIIADENFSLYKIYNIETHPTSLLFNPNGKLIQRIESEIISLKQLKL